MNKNRKLTNKPIDISADKDNYYEIDPGTKKKGVRIRIENDQNPDTSQSGSYINPFDRAVADNSGIVGVSLNS